jgi:DNA-binding LacI/PurR family transcriptional regulator
VTIGTVSGVLRDKAKERRISDEVVQRVLRIADQVDYAPNLLIRSLHRGNTHVISFLNGFRNLDRRHQYMAALTSSMEKAGGSLGYNVLMFCDFELSPCETYKYLNGGINDGLVFFKPQPSDPLLPFLRKSNLPIVLLNSVDDEGILSSVIDDWRSGIREVADQLAHNGHHRLAALTAEGHVDAENRIIYLRECLAGYGIDLPESRVIAVDGRDPAAVNVVVRSLMNEETPPTALFCWHDHLGYSVLEECFHLGIAVPTQVSVIGYDGIYWPARTTHILASVHVDIERTSELAVEALVDLINSRSLGPIQKVMPVRFELGTTLGTALK